MDLVKVEGLSKSYGKFEALKNIDLQIGTGLFGLLGPNGAGKSTLMNILSTVLPWDRGGASIYGFDLSTEGEKVRELLGYLPQHFHPPVQFTGREFLQYVASMKGIVEKEKRTAQVEQVLEQVNLQQQANKKIKGYSGGMKRRLGIAQALIGQPRLIILDEPTAGLDPSERIRFRNMIEKLSKEFTIILSTHIISDIESSCEHVGVMNHGEVLYHGTTTNLANLATNVVWELEVPYSQYDEVEKEHIILSSRKENKNMIIRVLSTERPQELATAVKPTIEDGYMAVINGVMK